MLRLQGHDAAVQAFEAALRCARMHHAYLITGPAHVGKLTLAMQIAQAVNCLTAGDEPCGTCEACTRIAAGTHADVRVIRVDPEATEGPKTAIGIDAVRELIASAHLRPYEGRTRVFVFDGADTMTNDAANALLKVLEEPPPDVRLLLLAPSQDSVLPTITSRCQHVELHPLPTIQVAQILQADHGMGAEQADIVARLSRGCLGWAIEAAHEPALLAGVHQSLERIAEVVEEGLEDRFGYSEQLARRFQRDRAAAREELYLWLRWLRDVLLVQQGQSNSIVNVSWRDTILRHAAALTPADTVRWLHLVTESIEALDRNANPRLALDVMMLEAPSLRTT
ncbi:MAG: DNA polymerase III subunit delta' [Chloroflexi bacterium]|nr:DNA polymerase III subunit delta' [Chloroflexota bacterium]MDA1173353.1 DNA polymerase III subunit delta' [Chloroflexota bacterium]